MRYVSLHHHSTYSFMDGFGTPAQHVARVAELGYEALALTEHGNVSSHVQLEKAASKAGIKPIFGLEAYTEVEPQSRRKFHLTLLAMDERGYRNLMRIVSCSWAEGFYQWPTVSGRMLAEHHEGLIVLSGCSDSLMACSLLGGKTIDPSDASYARAKTQALKFKELLGDRFYLEAQMFPELSRSCDINLAYERLIEETGIQLVATADCHYPQPEDNEMQVILHAAGRGAGTVAAQEATWEYDIRLSPPTDDAVVLDRLRGTGLSNRAAQAALTTTNEIAARCNVVLPKAERLRYPGQPGETSLEAIWRLMREGWAYRVRQGNRRMTDKAEKSRYVARIKAEMEQITSKDFVDYFLMLSDIVRHAKDNGVGVGPARGSAAASLVCYLLRITEIDPLQYPLMMFDRFIDPTREDLPDIDLDFDDDLRYRIRDYAVRRYGEDRVGNIANYSRFKGKTAVNDVARVFRVPFADTETVKSLIVERSGGDSRDDFSLMDTVEMFPAVKDAFERNKDLYKAIRLEGNYRGMSVHAAGLVIGNSPITDFCALYTKGKKVPVSPEHPDGLQTTTVVSVDKKDAEYLGLLKADLLGLSTMGMIRIALELAGLTLEDLYRVPVDDAETLRAFNRNDVIGIFQWEGRATRLVNREVRPTNFNDLTHVNTLSRPGPLFSGTTAEYIAVRRGEKEPTRFHPIIDELTAETFGQIIFQEQILKGLRLFGGLTVGRVHEIRRIISKKLGEAQFNTSSLDFINGAVEMHGVKPETAKAVWGRLVTAASYVFNVPHSVSYSMLAFWCMWLKVHYPAAFYTAQLRKSAEENWPRLIRDAERHGITVRGVDPALSARTWAIAERQDASYGNVVQDQPPSRTQSTHSPGALDGSTRNGADTGSAGRGGGHRAAGRDGGRTIVAGWLQLPGIGPSKADAIERYQSAELAAGRDGIKRAEDLLDVKGIGPAMVAKLRESLDSDDPFGLQRVAKALAAVRRSIRVAELPLRPATHTSDQILDLKGEPTIYWIGVPIFAEYKDYIENQRSRTGKEIEEIRKEMKRPDLLTFASLRCIDDYDEDVYLRFNRFQFPRFKRALERVRLGRDVVWVKGKKNNAGFGVSVMVEDMVVIDPE